MHKQKNINGWILCPSKSYPGKFYYFNVVNGEAAWCLTEAEKQALNKENAIKRVLDKTHSYPEPKTPPTQEDIANNSYNRNSPPTIYNQLPTPHIFGRPVFPKYIPHEYMQGYIWPIQPMFVANKPETIRLFDQVTQTSDHEQAVLIQSCSIPLSKRFGNYSQGHTKTFGDEGRDTSSVNWMNTNQVNIGTSQGAVFGPKINKHNIFNSNTDNLFKPISNYQNKNVNSHVVKEPVFKAFSRNDTITDNKYSDNIFISQFGQKSTLNVGGKVENCMFNQPKVNATTDIFKKPQSLAVNDSWADSSKDNKNIASQKSTLSEENRAQNTINTADVDAGKFNSTDLRYVLQAKRRKLHCNDGRTGQVDETSERVINELNIKDSVPKRVTFDDNLNEIKMVSNNNIMEDCNDSDKMTSPVLDISYLKSIAKPFLKTDPWYIVIDMGVLLDHFSFIDEFVKEDITCRVLVPNAVRTYIQTISVGEYAGRDRVISARKAIRQLTTPGQHVILQPPIMEKCSSSAIDGIIECCMQVQQQHHAVLVTTDKELFNKATAVGIYTYKIDDIKNNMAVTFDVKKINITVDNNDLFEQNAENYEPFVIGNKDRSAMDDSNVFKVPAAVKRSKEPLKKNNQVDIATSPIIFDKIYTKNVRECPNDSVTEKINKNYTYTESNIEENIRNLSLFENASSNKLESKVKSSQNQKYSALKFRRVIVNPNCTVLNESTDKKLQNSNMEPQKRVFRKIVLNRNNHLKRNTENNFIQPFTLESNRNENEKPQIKDSIVKPQNINVTVEPQSQNKTVEAQINNIKLQKTFSNDQRIKNVIKQNSIEKDVFKTNEMLRFTVKDSVMKRRIESRFDEWMCCFVQIMEDCLTDILMNNLTNGRNTLAAPWTLQEAVVTIKELYINKTDVKNIADDMFNVMSNASDKKGVLPKTMRAADFMKLFGLGVRLLELLQIILPLSTVLQASIRSLQNLLECIQDPTTDRELPTNHTPMRPPDVDDVDVFNRNVSPKKPSYIIEYLMKHYPSWKDYEEERAPFEQTNIQMKDTFQTQEPTVIKTFGKNLNNIKINKAKRITFENVPDETKPKENIKTNKEKEPKIDEKSKENRNNLNSTHIDEYLNKNPTNLNNGTEKSIRIIRKANLIEDFEARIRNKSNIKESYDMDALDFESYPVSNEFYNETNSFLKDANILHNNDNFASDDTIENYENAIIFGVEEPVNDSPSLLNDKNNDCTVSFNDKHNDFNDDTNDSGIENEGLHAYSFIKHFLTELSGSFKIIYDFIDSSIQEFRCDEIHEEAKKHLYERANETHLHVADIIGKLKKIIDREAAEKTKLKTMLVNAGVEAFVDKRITRYRQVVMKCLEQAQLLESALKTILTLTNRHSDISLLDLNENNTNIEYINIFE